MTRAPRLAMIIRNALLEYKRLPYKGYGIFWKALEDVSNSSVNRVTSKTAKSKLATPNSTNRQVLGLYFEEFIGSNQTATHLRRYKKRTLYRNLVLCPHDKKQNNQKYTQRAERLSLK